MNVSVHLVHAQDGDIGEACSVQYVKFDRTLDLGFDIVDGVGRLYLKGNSLARQGLDKDLHIGLRSVVLVSALDRVYCIPLT